MDASGNKKQAERPWQERTDPSCGRVSVPRFPEGLLLWSVSDLPPLSVLFNPCWDPGRSDETSAMLPIMFPMFMLGLASHVFVISLFCELIYSTFRGAVAFGGWWCGLGVGLFVWLVSATVLRVLDLSPLTRVRAQALRLTAEF